MTPTNRAGITTDDQVLVYLQTPDRSHSGWVNLHWAPVQKVSATQITVEGIRYHADPYNRDHRCIPVAIEERWVDATDDLPCGHRRIAHERLNTPFEMEHLLVRLDRSDALDRAQRISSDAYQLLGYPCHLQWEQLVELSADPTKMDFIEANLAEVAKAREKALTDGRNYFALMTGIELTDEH